MYTTHSMPSNAQTVAVATPCCPAPVSAMTRCFPMRLAKKRLPHRMVDLVRAGVGQVLALQVDARPTEVRREVRCEGQRRRPADIGGQQPR